MKFVKKYYKYFVIALLAILVLLEVTSSVQESQTIDEGVHLAAGYSYLKTGDFRLNPEHPPLLKELAAFPLLFFGDKINQPFGSETWSDANQWLFAKEILYESELSADTILLLGHIPIMLLSVLLGIFVFKWSRELFGIYGGLLALTLYCFSPTIIAHSRYVTTDVGMAAFYFITIYYFYKYLKERKKSQLILSALFCSFAIVSKFSALFLFPTLLLIFAVALIHQRHSKPFARPLKILCVNISIFLGIIILIIWAVYGFEIKKPIDDQKVQNLYVLQDTILDEDRIDTLRTEEQKLISITDTATQSGKNIQWLAQNIPIPAYTYFKGAITLLLHNYNGHTAYLMGDYTDYGWWYYFPIAFLVKTPTALFVFLLLLLLTYSVYITRGKHYQPLRSIFFRIPLHIYVITITIGIYTAFSLAGNLNIGVRHIIPLYPFIYVSLGSLAVSKFWAFKKIQAIIISMLVLYYLSSSILIYPHFLAYFNDISGGPENGPSYLVDSNIDWGQDVKKLQKYLQKNNISYVCMSYFGQTKLEYYDIDFRYLPQNPRIEEIKDLNCVVAISVTSLYSKAGEFAWLKQYTPIEKIGYSIYLYDLRK